MKLSGRSAVVTGAAGGLGLETSKRLALQGVRVIGVDLKSGADSTGIHYVEADVTKPNSLQAAFEAAVALAPLGILVSCAGIGIAEKVLGKEGPHDLEHFRKVIEVNLVGTFNALRLAAAAMRANDPDQEGERGIIVNTASVAVFEGQIGQASYAASKGGVVAMTLPAARELAAFGIRVVTIAPGLFDTPMLQGLPETVRQSLGQQAPFPSRLGRPGEYASLVLAIAENPTLNGETIRLDGALRLAPR